MEPVTVSIVVPCYNPPREPFIEMLNSLARSTYHGFELILVDDGSRNTEYLVELEKYPFNKQIVRHTHNRGLSAARNSGVAACHTTYYLQMDADDQIEPTFIEKCLWALESHPNWSFCNSWVTAFDVNSYKWDRGFERPEDFRAENQVTSIAMIRRSADQAMGGHDESIRDGCEDWDYWLNMANQGLWGGTIPEYLIRYRQRQSNGAWLNRDNISQRVEFRRNLKRRYPKLWREGFAKLQRPPQVKIWQPTNIPIRNLRSNTGVARFLLIVPWLTMGGADRFNLSLVQQLQQQGFEVILVVTTSGPHLWIDNFLGLTQEIFILGNFLTPEMYPPFLSYLIESRSIDCILISNAMLGYTLLPYLRSSFPDVTTADYIHMVPTGELDGGYARISTIYQNLLDMHIVSSQSVKQWMVQGVPEERVRVCYTNQDTKTWDPALYDRLALRQVYGLPVDVPVILYPARLEPQKRPRVLVEILQSLQKQYPNFVCLIAGQGPLQDWLQKSLGRLGLKRQVRMLGAVAADDMAAVMALSDILLLPSLDEGISLALYEAMAMGLTIVSAAVGGQAELVTSNCGYLIPQNADEVAEYARILIDLCKNPSKRIQMGQAARQRIIDSFGVEEMGKQMSQCLADAGQLHREKPYTLPSKEDSVAAARGAIDAIRLDRMQELLRTDLSDWRIMGDGKASKIGWWSKVTYQLKRDVLRPIYYWMLTNGMDWIVPVANLIYRKFQRVLR